MAQFSHRKYISGREKCLEKTEKKKERESNRNGEKIFLLNLYFCVYMNIYTAFAYCPQCVVFLNLLCF